MTKKVTIEMSVYQVLLQFERGLCSRTPKCILMVMPVQNVSLRSEK